MYLYNFSLPTLVAVAPRDNTRHESQLEERLPGEGQVVVGGADALCQGRQEGE